MTDSANPDLDADALFAALEAEDDLDDPSINPSYRAARLQQLSRDIAQSQQNAPNIQNGGSNFRTLKSDPEVLTFTTEYQRAILHFYHPDFARCAVMDQHLEALANAHGGEETVFGRVNVQNAEFVVQKLGVRVLPCVIGFADGVAKERITGFEGLAFGGDEKGGYVTSGIEAAFVKAGVLKRRKLQTEDGGSGDDEEGDEDERDAKKNGTARRGIKSSKRGVVDEDDDDWD